MRELPTKEFWDLRIRSRLKRAGGAGAGLYGDRIRAEQIRTLYRVGPVGVGGAAAAALLLVALLLAAGEISTAAAGGWLGYMALVVACHMACNRAYWRAQPPDAAWRFWARRFTFFSSLEGAAWGSAAFVLNTSGHLDQLLIILLGASNVTSGALAAFGSYIPAYFALFFPAAAADLIALAIRGEPLSRILATMVVVYSVCFFFLATRLNLNFLETIRLRFENLDLIENLRVQKEIAEQANVSKSRFLAAASHDLRQPVHALGLFVGALRARSMDAETERLVEHIDRSISALDSLFNSLLDISRLDAGVLEAHPQPFPIQPLLERVCRDYRQESEARGLRLVLHPSSAIIRADPILFERIVRNLVSNAVRFTALGRIVVGCMRCQDRLSVQVWDTGCGITPENQARVFDEFYQVGNTERDRTKGLGLGLAIVSRLSRLLQCPITLSSRPGKGSVFKVAVPLADQALDKGISIAGGLEVNILPGLILVVDDEAAI